MAWADFSDGFRDVWAQRVLTAFDTKAVYANLTNRDYDGDAKMGENVIINTVADFTLVDYHNVSGSTGMTTSDLSISAQTLPIDKWYYFSKNYQSLHQLWGSSDTFTRLVNRGADAYVSTADSSISALYSGIINSGSLNVIVSASVPAAMYNALVDVSVGLQNLEIPMNESFCVISPTQWGVLAKSSDLIRTIGVNGVYDGAYVGQMRIYVSPHAPVTSVSSSVVIAGHPSAWAFANAVQETRLIESENIFGNKFQGLFVYGNKIINPQGLYRQNIEYQSSK